VLAPGFLNQVAERGSFLKQGLQELAQSVPQVFSGVRGLGLMLGLVCLMPNTEIQAACIREGLLTVAAGENVLRLVPPLIVTLSDIEEALARLRRAALACLPHAELVAAK